MTRGRPVGLLVITGVIALSCWGLGFWQWRRLQARRAANAAALAQRELPPISLPDSADLTNRRVLVSGRYDHDHTVVLRGRVEREAPAVHLVTPLIPDGSDSAVLVLRGFVPAQDALRYDTALVARPLRAAVEGIAFPVPNDPDSGGVLEARGTETWRRLDLAALRSRLPYPLLAFYVQETDEGAREPGAKRFPQPVPPRPLDDGPHFSYMLQWIGIGLAALGFGVATWRGMGRRRFPSPGATA